MHTYRAPLRGRLTRRVETLQPFKGRLFLSLVACSLALAALTAPPSAFAETAPAQIDPSVALPVAPAHRLRVGLGRSLSAAEVAAPGGMLVLAGGAVVAETAPGQALKLVLDAGGIALPDIPARFPALRLVPLGQDVAIPADAAAPPPAPANFLTYGARRYRGEFEVLVNTKDRKLSVVNVVDLEEYLLAVVPREMSSDWPLEALKAQSVAARTYALSHLGRWATEGFDVVDTTLDQEYAGLGAERARTSEAVWATRGHVLTYAGQYANTMYHASSGGRTEANEIIYTSTPVPYLRSVPDFDNVPGNSRYAWTFTFSQEELNQTVQSAGYKVGTVAGVSPVGPVGQSGRPSGWSVAGALSSIRLTGQQFRTLLGLPSSPRSVTVQQGGVGNAMRTYQAGDTITVMGPNGTVQARTVRGTAIAVAAGAPAAAAGAVTAVGGNLVSRPAGLVVEGGGYGHAVGMSQWGAYAMAQQGKTYAQILTHYYTGTQVEVR
jgi:stage II sporulation protein D